jgi:hypothetical protein
MMMRPRLDRTKHLSPRRPETLRERIGLSPPPAFQRPSKLALISGRTGDNPRLLNEVPRFAPSCASSRRPRAVALRARFEPSRDDAGVAGRATSRDIASQPTNPLS